mmetsp:Transcript_2080/g.5722  ORF Transcript_2080/g.5722 Transcript_2080/m.5722 type:complete len:262 (-) Transcript_2080:632-1417(-)
MREKSTEWSQDTSTAMPWCMSMLARTKATVDALVRFPHPSCIVAARLCASWPPCPLCPGIEPCMLHMACSDSPRKVSHARIPPTSRSCSNSTWLQKCTSPSRPPILSCSTQVRLWISTRHMSSAPMWCAIIPRTKSTSAEPVKLIAIPRCICMFVVSQSLAASGHRVPPQPMFESQANGEPHHAAEAHTSPAGQEEGRGAQESLLIGGTAGHDTAGKQLGSAVGCFSEKSLKSRTHDGVGICIGLQKFSTQVPRAMPSLLL